LIRNSLDTCLKPEDFYEVFGFTKPPQKILDLFAALGKLLLMKETDWDSIRRFGKNQLLKSLSGLDFSKINIKNFA